MSKVGFGEHLKREREMRGVSLDEICAATRIGTRFLEALENEAWDRLPGGVFNRGFVRAVARFLGLDEEGMVAEYVLAFNEQGAPPSPPAGVLPAKTIDWRPWIGVTLILLLVAAGWLGWRLYLSHRPPAVVVPLAAVNRSPARGSTHLPAAVPPSSAAAPLRLKIEAGKPTTVTVSADGSRVFDGRIAAGEDRTFEAQTEFQVASRDAGALLLELNGHTLPPIGPPGRFGKVTLTRRDLTKTPGGTD